MPVEHSLPFGRNLLITTSNSIHLQTPTGDKTIFECASAGGIVNACAAPDNSSLLAIADSHGVLVHDTAQPRDEKHKLKDSSVSNKDPSMHEDEADMDTGYTSLTLLLTRLTHPFLQHHA